MQSQDYQELGPVLPSDLPETYGEFLEHLKDQHEAFLNDAEGLLVEAIANSEWQPLLDHLNDFLIENQSEYILTLWKRGSETNGNSEGGR